MENPNIDNFKYAPGPSAASYRLKIAVILTVTILLAGNIFFAVLYVNSQKKINSSNNSLTSSHINFSVINFNKLFVEKVLRSQGSVSDDDRLILEKAATDTNDAEIIAEWHKFLVSTNENKAQASTLALLKLFADKAVY